MDYGNSTLFGQWLVKKNSCDPILCSMWGNGFLVVKGREKDFLALETYKKESNSFSAAFCIVVWGCDTRL